MENIFYNFTYNAIKLKKIKEEMKWYQKINPVYNNKIKSIVKNLDGYIDQIRTCKMTRQLLLDLQRIYIMNIDNIKYENLSIPNINISNIKCIFYPMIFNTVDDGVRDMVTINITGNTVHIKSENFHSITFVDELEKNNDLVIVSIKNTICEYLEQYLA